MKTYLSVPYAEKDEAQKLGAKWDPQKKLWYSATVNQTLAERWPLNNEPIVELVGEDRNFGGNKLFVDLVPSTCWFTNVRTCVHFSDWDRLRRFVYTRANKQCECCHAKSTLDAHERWLFDKSTKIQKLMRIIALCKACHEVTHMGLAQIKGRGEPATKHLMDVLGINKHEAKKHIEQAFSIWNERNQLEWELDLTIITDSGIKLADKFDGTKRKYYAQTMTEAIQKKEQLNYHTNNIQNPQIYNQISKTNKMSLIIKTISKYLWHFFLKV